MTLEEILIDCVQKVKGENILVYDMDGRNPFYDKMILASVGSQRQADAIISYIEDSIKDTEYKIRNVEGQGSPWVLIDLNSIILSIFTHEEREHFQIEKVYMDYKSKRIDEEK